MSVHGRFLRLTFVVSALLALGMPANAIGDFSSATVNLTGTIRPKCNISIHSINLNETSPTSTSNFNIDCNTPMQYTIKADYGRLRHTNYLSSTHSDIAGFVVELPYSLDITANNNPYGQMVSGVTIAQDALTNGAVVTANTGAVTPYTTTGTLSITRQPLPIGQVAQAGNYQDRVTIEVTAFGS